MQGQEVLRTERLRLRLLEQRDLKDLGDIYSDPLVMRYYPALRARDRMQEWLDPQLALYAERGYSLYAVERLRDGVFLGVCGHLHQTVDGESLVEVAYLFKSMHWHRGYASEAAIGCREFGFRVLRQPKLISLIRPENGPSRAVAERNGMKVEKTTIYRDIQHLVYAVHAPSNG